MSRDVQCCTSHLTSDSVGAPKLAPELPRREDAGARLLRHRVQVGIAGNEDICGRGMRARQHPAVCFVADADRIPCLRPANDLECSKIRLKGVDLARWHPESLGQHTPQLLQDDLAEHEFMLGNNGAKEISAQAAGRERADEHVGVEKNSHDTSRNTSSSVR